jgi:hypothetical protein
MNGPDHFASERASAKTTVGGANFAAEDDTASPDRPVSASINAASCAAASAPTSTAPVGCKGYGIDTDENTKAALVKSYVSRHNLRG